MSMQLVKPCEKGKENNRLQQRPKEKEGDRLRKAVNGSLQMMDSQKIGVLLRNVV
jgi:hypothetical protein